MKSFKSTLIELREVIKNVEIIDDPIIRNKAIKIGFVSQYFERGINFILYQFFLV